ncbi:hypothetical protein EJV47_09950 [Hymenobacter gummosus]|uniref:Uncharacterized protein n=1 Tax=Hymenobacter gummosus TaxID=1776032 RepID=A0A3S0JIH7_9BACT|nr:hypothetical protein [Hymenobacter gummosus]RTQ50926.1 hypothetical protein EJV47_09950 [Hymenobacter gummosus]
MPNFYHLLMGVLLMLGLTACTARGQQPAEVSGTVLGWTCREGLIIEVDQQYPIGRPVCTTHENHRDAIVGRNAIAAVNNADFRRRQGQRLRFRYAPADSVAGRVCPGWHQRQPTGLLYFTIQITDSRL